MRPLTNLLQFAALVCGVASSAQAQTWNLASEPLFETGTSAGDSDLGFGSIGGIVWLDGFLAIADVQANHVVLVDERTQTHRTVGRFGGGPGEFRTIRAVLKCSASRVFVYDPAVMRVSVFSTAGVFERAIDVRSLSTSGAPPYDLACSSSGHFVAVNRSPAPPGGIGPRRPEVALQVYPSSGRQWSGGRVPASERYFDGSNDFPRPFGMQTSVAVGSRFWVLGTSEGDSLSVFAVGDSGRLIGTIRTGFTRRSLTRKVIETYVNSAVAARAGRADTVALRTLYSELEYPELSPAYRRVLIGTNDEIWVEQYPVPGDATAQWAIFSPEGMQIGRLGVPGALRLEAVDADRVVGVWRGSDDVLRVRSYRYSRR